MGFLAHIRRCNAHDLTGFLPFRIGAERVGWVRPDVQDVLMDMGGAFETVDGAVRLAPGLMSFADRSAALDDAALALVEAGIVRKMRSEFYGVKNRWSQTPLAAINRGAVAAFGLRAYGVHLNGWRRRADGGVEIWVGRRAPDKAVAPGKLDNMVAGGQPIGLSLMANLVKEAAEEANMSATLARQSRPIGCIAYAMETDRGFKPDVMFCFDIELPQEFVPVNTDGETASFEVMAAETVADLIRNGDDFKFNVNLAVTHFLVRHGLIDPDAEPDYAAIVAGLCGPTAVA